MASAAIRQAIGAWAYTLGAGAERPGPEALRAALGVACAVRELALDPARRAWQGGAGDALLVPVPEDVTDLAARSGFAPATVERALELLALARVVTRQIGARAATVTLAADVLVPAPRLAQLDWSHVRARLDAVGGSLAPALAVLRELAARVGAFEADAAASSVRASVRDLEDATAFGRSTVSEALAALERARLLDVETRAGRTTRFLLRPSTVGAPDEAPLPRNATPAASQPAQPGSPMGPDAAGLVPTPVGAIALPTAPRPSDPLSSPPVPLLGAARLLGTFAGTPIYGPPGTPLVIDCDAAGRWTCRVGPWLVLGPIEPQ